MDNEKETVIYKSNIENDNTPLIYYPPTKKNNRFIDGLLFGIGFTIGFLIVIIVFSIIINIKINNNINSIIGY